MNDFKRKSIIFSWMLSYLVVSLTAMIVYVISYHNLEKNIMEKNNSYNVELLNNIKIAAEGVQQNAMSTAMSVSNNSQVREVASYSRINGEFMEKMSDVKNSLIAEYNTDMYIDDIFVYLHNTDYIIGVNSGNIADKYFRTYGSPFGSVEEIHELLQSNHYLDSVSTDDGKDNLKGDVLIMNTVYGVTFDAPIATVVIRVDYKEFMDSNYLTDGTAGFHMLKDNGELLVTNNFSEYEKCDYKNVDNPKDGENVRINHNKVTIITSSANAGFSVARTYDYDEYMGDITALRIIIYVVLALYVLVCGVLIYNAIRKNYAPIRRIIEYAEKNIGTSIKDKENEFFYIYNSLSDIIDKNNKNYNRLDAWSKVVKNNVIAKLLKNVKLQKNTDIELYDSFCDSFNDKNYIVVACIPDVSNGVFPMEEPGTAEDIDGEYLARFITNNILDEQLEAYTKEFVEVDGILHIIIASNKKNFSDSVCRVLEKFPETIGQYFSFDITFVVSNEHQSLQSISLAYNEILTGINYQFITDNRIIRYADLEENDYNIYSFSFEQETFLVNSLRETNYDKSMAVINEVFDENIKSNQTSVLSVRCLMYNLVGNIISVINKSDVFKYSEILRQPNIFERIEKCTTVYSMRDELEKIVKEFCETKSSGTEKGQELADSLEKYILAHYGDCNLGGIMLEDEFNKSYSYLSKVFKKYKMVGLLNYITDVRIKKSIELLKTTDYSVSKIAQMVGYSNDRSFSRVFTKINGVSPGKYRE